MKVVRVKMDDVECISAARHTIEHYKVIWERILALQIEPQGAFAGCLQNP